MSPFAKRLKEARKFEGLSQERVGVLAGIDEASASARMNQYERGKHVPDFLIAKRIAGVLNVPTAYFYAEEADLARMILAFNKVPKKDRGRAIAEVESMAP